MRLRFQQVDVFTNRLFGGNPLAVYLDGDGLETRVMQQIAREMNLSETTFVQTATNASCAFKVRIFTPGAELQFAGHPTIGTAYVLRALGKLPGGRFRFEEGAGPVPLREDGAGRLWMTPPRASAEAPLGDADAVAGAIGVAADAIAGPSRFSGGGGMRFFCIVLNSKEAVDAAEPDRVRLASFAPQAATGDLLIFSHSGSEVYSRMIAAPAHGIGEDPATGSSVGPLCQVLHASGKLDSELHALTIEQGTKMGRQSFLHVRFDPQPQGLENLEVGGDCVPVFESFLEI